MVEPQEAIQVGAEPAYLAKAMLAALVPRREVRVTTQVAVAVVRVERVEMQRRSVSQLPAMVVQALLQASPGPRSIMLVAAAVAALLRLLLQAVAELAAAAPGHMALQMQLTARLIPVVVAEVVALLAVQMACRVVVEVGPSSCATKQALNRWASWASWGRALMATH